MGALAGLLRAVGHDVRGSDHAVYPPMSDQLDALEIPIFEGFSPNNLEWGPDVVVVGNVCRKDHIEVVEAQRLGLPLASLPSVLAEAFLAGKRSVVVTGTHGKSTTTALLAHILLEAGRDPGFFIGAVPINQGTGWRYGTGREFLVEGDEYDSAFFDKGSKFLHYQPEFAALTSVELDHVDIFATMNDVRNAFRKFVALIPNDGYLAVCASSPDALAIADSDASCRVETYAVAGGVGEPERSATWQARHLSYTKSGRCRFELHHEGKLYDRYESLLMGSHNVGNAIAAIALAHTLSVPAADIRRGVASFAGVKRRQEVCGIAQGVYVLDDYAHHPTAVEATLKSLRKRFQSRRLVAVFEPRSATSRRKTFQREYAKALAHADSVIVGRLHDPSSIPREDRLDPEKLALELHGAVTPAKYVESVDNIVEQLAESARPGDVIAVLSSGEFDGLHGKLLAALGDAVRSAKPTDMREVRGLAVELGWPIDQLGDEMYGNFLVLHNETGFVGCVGLEFYGEAAILRSLAVKKAARGIGYGWLLAEAAVQVARHRGVKRIYLLTEHASDFFAAKLGFRVVDVSTVSHAVSNSPIFQSQVKNDAIAMRLDL
ncbi:MAG: GNAT family N-acetyltransferase [Proteobacteria bacterium]|nr:GNAT family N-acetyltransferase [Pseudomonadota bacterium]